MAMKTENESLVGKEFTITREFDAPRELVFKAWTAPKHLAQWWGPRRIHESGLRMGRAAGPGNLCRHARAERSTLSDGRRVPRSRRAGKTGVHKRRAGWKRRDAV